MPQNNAGRYNYTSPIYGEIGYFRVSDLPTSQDAGGTAALTAVSTATTSASLALGCRSIELATKFSDTATTCDILVYRVDPGPVDTLMYTFTGVSGLNSDGLFVGGNEGVTFKGLNVKIRAQNFAGGGSVTVNVKKTG